VIEYQQNDATRRLHWVAHESVTVDDVLGVADRRATEGAWSFPVLYDARHRTGSLTLDELRELDRCVSHHTAKQGHRGRMAVIVGPKAQTVRRTFSMIGKFLSVEHRVFTRVSAANAWMDRADHRQARPLVRSTPPCPRCQGTDTLHSGRPADRHLVRCIACQHTWDLSGEPATESAARCASCSGMLLPPQITGFTPPPGTDYVCLKCGRPYRWAGYPPKLVTVFVR
jgi:hypothetical protein